MEADDALLDTKSKSPLLTSRHLGAPPQLQCKEAVRLAAWETLERFADVQKLLVAEACAALQGLGGFAKRAPVVRCRARAFSRDSRLWVNEGYNCRMRAACEFHSARGLQEEQSCDSLAQAYCSATCQAFIMHTAW